LNIGKLLKKTEKEFELRLKFLEEFKLSITNPHEIWKTGNKLSFIRVFKGQRGAQYLMAFTILGNQVNSYFLTNKKKQSEKRRVGTLVYKRPTLKNRLT